MFKFVPNTGVPGFRVGLPEGSDQRTPAAATDARTYDYYPYGDATLASGDPSGVGTNPPNIFISPWSRQHARNHWKRYLDLIWGQERRHRRDTLLDCKNNKTSKNDCVRRHPP